MKSYSLIQKLAFAYAGMFFFIAIMGYIPWFLDADGYLFGLFDLELKDDLLHAFSGVWALIAGFMSHRQSVLFFRLFGLVYFFDGVVGLLFGNAYLDLAIFFSGVADIPFLIKVFANLPHIGIGGIAILIGFVLTKRVRAQ